MTSVVSSKDKAKRRPPASLAFSGGGFRATLFHLGVLLTLVENDDLDEDDVVVGVSGGAILAAFWGTHYQAFSNRIVDNAFAKITAKKLLSLVRSDLRNRVFLRCLATYSLFGAIVTAVMSAFYFRPPLVWEANSWTACAGLCLAAIIALLSGWATGALGWTLGPILERHYADLCENCVLADMSGNVYLTATSLTDGKLCVAGNHKIALYHCNGTVYIQNDQGAMPVAKMVCASSAFPPAFSPIGVTLTEQIGNIANHHLHYLTDGGVYDNLGIWTLRKTKAKLGDPQIPSDTPTRRTIISDAAPPLQSKPNAPFRNALRRNMRASDLLMYRLAESDLSDSGSVEHVQIFDLAVSRPVPHMRNLASFRTDLDRCTDAEIASLVFHGARMAFEKLGNGRANWRQLSDTQVIDFLGLKGSLTSYQRSFDSMCVNAERMRRSWCLFGLFMLWRCVRLLFATDCSSAAILLSGILVWFAVGAPVWKELAQRERLSQALNEDREGLLVTRALNDAISANNDRHLEERVPAIEKNLADFKYVEASGNREHLMLMADLYGMLGQVRESTHEHEKAQDAAQSQYVLYKRVSALGSEERRSSGISDSLSAQLALNRIRWAYLELEMRSGDVTSREVRKHIDEAVAYVAEIPQREHYKQRASELLFPACIAYIANGDLPEATTTLDLAYDNLKSPPPPGSTSRTPKLFYSHYFLLRAFVAAERGEVDEAHKLAQKANQYREEMTDPDGILGFVYLQIARASKTEDMLPPIDQAIDYLHGSDRCVSCSYNLACAYSMKAAIMKSDGITGKTSDQLLSDAIQNLTWVLKRGLPVEIDIDAVKRDPFLKMVMDTKAGQDCVENYKWVGHPSSMPSPYVGAWQAELWHGGIPVKILCFSRLSGQSPRK